MPSLFLVWGDHETIPEPLKLPVGGSNFKAFRAEYGCQHTYLHRHKTSAVEKKPVYKLVLRLSYYAPQYCC